MRGLDNYRSPSRKPWLFFVVLAVLGFFAWSGLRKKPEAQRAAEREDVPGAAVGEVVQPAAAPASRLTDSPLLALPLVSSTRVPLEERSRIRDTFAAVREQRGGEGGALAARAVLVAALSEIWSPEAKFRLEDELSVINRSLVFGPAHTPEKKAHEVRRGDVISKIAPTFGTTVEMTQIINELTDPDRIRVGQRLLFMTGRFELEVRLSRHELAVFREGAFYLKFPVGLGSDGKTPTGTFRITDRIERPPWTSPAGIEYAYGHPENILGTHWMRIVPTGGTPAYSGLGIHGTADDSSIGRDESAGCVRMFNRDVERLFALVPVGTPVRIVE